MKEIKKVSVERATMKTIKFLKDNIKGLEVNEEGEIEIYKAIAMQTEENLEQIIAESLGVEIIESLNSKCDPGDATNETEGE